MSRLDAELFRRGLCSSRSKAHTAVTEGRVEVNGKCMTKPSYDVAESDELRLLVTERYVSRGAYKLLEALDVFGIGAEGKICLDIGASTGGFTQVLLERGAKTVYALDVGTAQLADIIRSDARVIPRDNVNCRYLTKEMFMSPIELAVMDVSFISQALIYPAVSEVLGENGVLISLIKPQFEAGRQNIGKNGIVKDRDGRLIADIIKNLKAHADTNGLTLEKYIPSPIPGGDGNNEYLALIRKK